MKLLQKYFLKIRTYTLICIGSSFFLVLFSETVLGQNKITLIDNVLKNEMQHIEKQTIGLKQENICDRVKEQIPDIDKNLDIAAKMFQSLANRANNYIEENTGVSAHEVAQSIQQGIKNTHPSVKSFLNNRGITIRYVSTESPIPIVINDCSIKLNLFRKIDVPGGYIRIGYEKE